MTVSNDNQQLAMTKMNGNMMTHVNSRYIPINWLLLCNIPVIVNKFIQTDSIN